MKNILSGYELEREEIGYTVGDSTIYDNKIKVHIPKLLPMVEPKLGKQKTPYLENIFVNGKSSRPAYDKVVVLQNYVEIPVLGSVNFSRVTVFDKDDNKTIIPNGTKVLCLLMNKNVNEMYISDVII